MSSVFCTRAQSKQLRGNCGKVACGSTKSFNAKGNSHSISHGQTTGTTAYRTNDTAMKQSILLTVGDISIQVQFKPIQNLYLRIRRDELNGKDSIQVSAPLQTSLDTLTHFVESRIQWIERQRRRLCVLELPAGSVQHLGKIIDRNALVDALCGLEKATDEQRRQADRGRTAVWQHHRRRVLQELLAGYVEQWQARLGLYAESWHIRRMKSRWGSCQVIKKRLCFNEELVAHAPECIEYVVVHELMHLAERGHGKKFWNRMDAALPDWKQRRQQLNGKRPMPGI